MVREVVDQMISELFQKNHVSSDAFDRSKIGPLAAKILRLRAVRTPPISAALTTALAADYEWRRAVAIARVQRKISSKCE
jgi:hypothetical protein